MHRPTTQMPLRMLCLQRRYKHIIGGINERFALNILLTTKGDKRCNGTMCPLKRKKERLDKSMG